MAITTYSTLKSAVADFVHRSDLTTVIETCISLVEADIAVDVRCQAMETIASGNLTGATLAFPSRMIEARRLLIAGDVYRYVTPEVFSEVSANGSTDHVYTIVGQAFYILRGASGMAYTLTYWAKFTSLSSERDATNWLIINHPDVYLYGTLRHVCLFLVDDPAAAKYFELYKVACRRVNDREARAAVSGGPLQMFAANVE